MAKILVVIGGCLLALTLGTLGLSIDETITRCTESCLKINPYDNITHAHPPDNALVKHCAKLTPDGKCECDWEKILTPEGECECRNPRHSVNEANDCVCDPGKCPSPSALMSGCRGTLTVKEELLDDCCPQYECDDCPDGSYRSNHTQDDKCVCYPCKLANCKSNQSTVIIRKGNQKPGTCCDLYRCDDLSEKRSCIVEGKTHPNGDSWLPDGCTIYRCENGIIFHEALEDCKNKKFCFSKGQVYENFQSWMEDECTNCTCVNGVKKCMAHFCKEPPSATIRPKEEDCPIMDGCKKACPFGFRLNKRGCELCKCRQPDAKVIQDILRALNCTAESCDVLHSLPSICNEKIAVSVEQCPKCADPSPQSGVPAPAPTPTFWSAVLLTATGTLAVLCAVLLWLYCRERRRGLCSLHRPHAAAAAADKYLHIPIFDANLNTQDNKAAMLLSATGKNNELKEYR